MKKKTRGFWYKVKHANYKKMRRNCVITINEILAGIAIMFLIFILPCLFR